ncbi:Rap1a/Tai family immunity protein [Zhongshania aliphaticivorans]|jgi:hypothetical protein|uniref:Rap1a/Tai family immunity protein n=1 Tax=Zhongshania aliphaticivorans TaxID=1470434 RepID=UPI0012E5724C|nr:Rap1a/Tai family immunity protein [Zhongshania aliphaticivorans]CAA0107174.1 Uncharacterised protein [Zhongshania aliphaticivorans]
MLVYKRYFKLTLAVCCGFLGSTTAVAVETLNTNKLQRSCVEYITETANRDATICSAYLQGFVSGSSQIVLANDEQSDFTQRAIRTRAPGGSIEIDSLKGARYCLPANTSIEQLAGQIANASVTKKDQLASALMKQVLKAHYQC